jgi:predicted XRE-type DNA-binding protein
MGFAEPEEEPTKAQLATHIRQVIKRRRLIQAAAPVLMGIDQPKVSTLLNGRLANFSSERLMRLLTALGQDMDHGQDEAAQSTAWPHTGLGRPPRLTMRNIPAKPGQKRM